MCSSDLELLMKTEKHDLVKDSGGAVKLLRGGGLGLRAPWMSCANRIEERSKGAFLAAIRGQHSAAIDSLKWFASLDYWKNEDDKADCPYSVAATVGNYDVMLLLLNHSGTRCLHSLSCALIPACQNGCHPRIISLFLLEMRDTIPFGYPDDLKEAK